MPVYKIKFGHADKSKRFPALICLAVFGGCLFCMIRGLRIWPNTPGRAFYSKTAFHNHSALNPLFNIAYTSLKAENFSKQFRFFTEEERADIYDSILPRKGNAFPTDTTECLLKTTRPNILFIVLEGFGAVFIENLGGMKGIAPNIDRISEEAISFTRCYCNSFRTDRGIVSILSGYPAQPTTSIMRYSHKIQSLPGLPKTLKSYGYRTQALYASDMTFFNMADYFISAGHDKLISQDSFPASDRTCKWGVPDHIAFNWLYRDIQQKYGQGKEPWYTTFLTISSHAPFDVPYYRLADKKFNAFAYTDSCFGDFIDRLKNTPAWDNLLICLYCRPRLQSSGDCLARFSPYTVTVTRRSYQRYTENRQAHQPDRLGGNRSCPAKHSLRRIYFQPGCDVEQLHIPVCFQYFQQRFYFQGFHRLHRVRQYCRESIIRRGQSPRRKRESNPANIVQ